MSPTRWLTALAGLALATFVVMLFISPFDRAPEPAPADAYGEDSRPDGPGRHPKVAAPERHVGERTSASGTGNRVSANDAELAEPEAEGETPVTFQLIDDHSGNPLADAPIRFCSLRWDHSAARFADIPPTGDLSTSATGEVALANSESLDPEELEQLKDGFGVVIPVEFYPLPLDCLPKTSATEVWLAIELRLKTGAREPIPVRVTPAATLQVRCIREDGTPAPGLIVRVYPDSQDDIAGAMYEDDHKDLAVLPGPPQFAANQAGKGSPLGVTFEFAREAEWRASLHPRGRWQALTGEDGTATIHGLPRAGCWVQAYSNMARAQHAVARAGEDESVEFVFPPLADLELRIVYLGQRALDESGQYEIETGEGLLVVTHTGNPDVTVLLKNVAPGMHVLAPKDEGEPITNIVIDSGMNRQTMWIGSGAWCEWHVHLAVNGSRLEEFSIPWKVKGSPPLIDPATGQYNFLLGSHGSAWFTAAEPAHMAPGTYIVCFPDGREEELTFVPGSPVFTRLDLEVREVTFSISHDFYALLQSADGGEPSISLSLHSDRPGDWLAASLVDRDEEDISALRPANPVTKLIPLGVYNVAFYRPQKGGYLEAYVDLRDPALDMIHFSRNGWPGAGFYDVQLLRGADGKRPEIYFVPESIHSEAGLHDEETLRVLELPGGMRATELSSFYHQFWFPAPGTYEVLPEMIRGNCSVKVVGGESDMDGYVTWKSGGVEFYQDLQQGWDDLGQHIDEAGNLPVADVELVVTRKAGPGGIRESARVSLRLSATLDIRVDDLDWKPCGHITLRGMTYDDWATIVAPVRGFEGDRRPVYERISSPPQTSSAPLPPGDYRVRIALAGDLPEIRTVRVEAGRETIIDVR